MTDHIAIPQVVIHAVTSETVALIRSWASLYSDSKSVAGATTFVHLGGMLLGGGCAIATDRLTLRAFSSGPFARSRQLSEVHAVHTVVLAGLVLTCLSGALMFMADIHTFIGSPVFWTKAGLVMALLANGGLMQRAESRLRAGKGSAPGLWDQLRVTSYASLGLWFAVVLAGTALTAAA
jgi:hypothetical protein